MTTPTLGARRTAYVIWGALLCGVLMFAAIASYVGPGMRETNPSPPLVLADISVLLAVLGVLASRLLPPRLRLGRDLDDPDAIALSRNIVATALCEGTGLFAVVVWMLTGSERAVLAFVVAIAGILACFPADARWRSLVPGASAQRGPSGPSRMVR